MSLFSRSSNEGFILREFFHLYGVHIPASDIFNELNIHPEYPNLLALVDVMGNFGVKTEAYRVDEEGIVSKIAAADAIFRAISRKMLYVLQVLRFIVLTYI